MWSRELLFVVFLAGLLVPLAQVEFYRLTDCLAHCRERRELQLELLSSRTCRQQHLRSGLSKVGEACWEAQQEHDNGVYACSVKKWWAEGEVKALYARIFQSPLMLYALLLPTILFTVYSAFAYCAQRRRDESMFAERRVLVRELSETLPAPRTPVVSPARQRLPRAEAAQQYVSDRRLTNRERRLIKANQ